MWLSQRMKTSARGDQTLWRIVYVCNGACQRQPPSRTRTIHRGPAELVYEYGARVLGQPRLAEAQAEELEDSSEEDWEDIAEEAVEEETDSPACDPQEAVDDVPDTDSTSDMEIDEESCFGPDRSRRAKKRHSCGVEIKVSEIVDRPRTCLHQLEVTVASASRNACLVTMLDKDHHQEPLPWICENGLKVSPYVRRMLHEQACLLGMTESKVKICELWLTPWISQMTVGYDSYRKTSEYIKALETQAPFRCPDALVRGRGPWRNAITVAQRQDRICDDPLAAMETLHRRQKASDSYPVIA